MASIRIGQQAADNQFAISEFGNSLYINSTFGWPTIFAADMPSSGPAYPLATPGVRFKANPNDHLALLVGVYNGDPSGAGFTGLQENKDPAGINFRLQDPPLLMAEAQYRYNQDKTALGLAGTIKLGGWYHFGKINDEHFGLVENTPDKGIDGIDSAAVTRQHVKLLDFLSGFIHARLVGATTGMAILSRPQRRNARDKPTHKGFQPCPRPRYRPGIGDFYQQCDCL